jgi:hypothetical protein
MDIKIVPREPDYRHRRNSGWGRFLAQFAFYLASLIPMCIVAWRIDLLGINAPQEKTVSQQPQPRIERQPPPRIVERPQGPIVQRETSRPPLQSTSSEESIPRAEPEIGSSPQPLQRENVPKPRSTQVIRLNLEKQVQREPITLVGDIVVSQVEGFRYSLNPIDGVLPTEVTLHGPRPVVLNVSLNDRRMLVIEPVVKNDAGKSVPFTTKNLDSIRRRVVKTGTTTANQLAAWKSERAQLQAWLESSVLKPLPDYRAATARIKQLDISIPDVEKRVAALEIEAKAMRELLEFAEGVHGDCTLIVESSNETTHP